MHRNILLPGGYGYLGSHIIVQILISTTFRITVIGKSNLKFIAISKKILQIIFLQIKGDRPSQIYDERLTFYEGNILDTNFLDTVFSRQKEKNHPITSIINLAAKKSVPQSVLNPLQYYQNNLKGLINLIKIMEKHEQCKQFIFSSTVAVYGQQNNCTEQFCCCPINPYGESKLCGQMFLKSVAKVHPNWKIISLRYSNFAGNHCSGLIGDDSPTKYAGNLFAVIQQVIVGKRQFLYIYGDDYNTTDGTVIRDFIHVVDLAKAHIQVIHYINNKFQSSYEIFNLGSGKGFSVLEVIKQFEKITAKNLNYIVGSKRLGDVEKLIVICKKAEQTLGWRAQKTLKDMCQSCIKYLQNYQKSKCQ